ncbi:hypothetical protein HK405_003178, partial [Cladochytrium tenue]
SPNPPAAAATVSRRLHSAVILLLSLFLPLVGTAFAAWLLLPPPMLCALGIEPPPFFADLWAPSEASWCRPFPTYSAAGLSPPVCPASVAMHRNDGTGAPVPLDSCPQIPRAHPAPM